MEKIRRALRLVVGLAHLGIKGTVSRVLKNIRLENVKKLSVNTSPNLYLLFFAVLLGRLPALPVLDLPADLVGDGLAVAAVRGGADLPRHQVALLVRHLHAQII